MRTRLALFALAAVLSLSACDRIDRLLGNASPVIKRAPGERIDVMLGDSHITADPTVADVPVEVPEPTDLAEWHGGNDAMALAPHVALSGVTQSQSATIGDGNGFSRSTVPAPVVAEGNVFAMDARGIVTAHDVRDIRTIHWSNEDGIPADMYDVLGGGLAYDAGVLYVTTGFGNLRAIDAKTGTTKWQVTVGAPVRGAPAVGSGMAVVLTADNQTLAFDETNGQPRWDHRGIRESAGFFSTTGPVISDGIVVAAYSSGEVFALRAETGSVLWSDTLRSGGRTRADAVFSGIDADPIVQDGVVVVA
ncbi:MAG: PQQ-binding-like beta-propeller repeat protein, partial [Rickettsiales bacterium]